MKSKKLKSALMTGALSCTIASISMAPVHTFAQTTDEITFTVHQQSSEKLEGKFAANENIKGTTPYLEEKEVSQNNVGTGTISQDYSKVSTIEKIKGLWRSVGGALAFDLAGILLKILSKF
ncbi:hypothetical protein ACLBXI_27875 [Bacillus cereus]